jgi:hypothetical protein
MNNAEELQAILLDSRNEDGGWPFRRGRSWTEPTALALLALQGAQVPSQVRAVSAAWLARCQSADGGWPPCADVPTSTWVTSLALLALGQETEHSMGYAPGTLWLSSHVYPELSPFRDFLQNSLGVSPDHAPGSSPWFPGTAGWVVPTAFTILALSSWSGRMPKAGFEQVIHRAQTYLIHRRCSDSGWNHGGSSQRSETAPSYAETTGLGLLALANWYEASLEPTLRLAEHFIRQPDSTEGYCWLVMGLAAHGRQPNDIPACTIRPKTTQEVALRLIAIKTLQGHNPFLKAAI